MTDTSLGHAPSRPRLTLPGHIAWPALSVLATLIALALLPEPPATGADPTPFEEWRGNSARFIEATPD